MIKRYSTPEMSKIWSERNKFLTWLRVELAVIRARVEMEEFPEEIYRRIKNQARVSVRRTEEIEKKTKHDLLAFVKDVRDSLDPDLRKYFHLGMTSFDTEEPATSLFFVESGKLIVEAIDSVLANLLSKAREFSDLIGIGRTHGMHGEPIVFGLRFLRWYDDMERAKDNLMRALDQMRASCINGAMGTYGPDLTPEHERRALAILHLVPARISSQIICRDRHYRVLSELAAVGSVIENIALNIRLSGMTEIREMQEFFDLNQKGSSAMPHKKNPIFSENMCGLPRVIRGNTVSAAENVAVFFERDISHSSVERVIFPDSFQALHFTLRRLSKVLSKLIINRQRVKDCLNLSKGAIYAGEVRNVLQNHGMDPEDAYVLAQELAFEAMGTGRQLKTLLLRSSQVPDSAKKGDIQSCFNPKRKLKYVKDIYSRFPQAA